MADKKTYKVVKKGKKAERRDYSKVSSSLPLPNLVEIQTDSFDWFTKEGIRNVFEEIYPITNYAGNISLQFVDYEFEDPKYDIDECKVRESNYAAPLSARMELQVVDNATGEVLNKTEKVFLGEFPMMTPTGTFIINGAERVIVSQIVRSPGAYFKVEQEDRTGRELFTSELIPSRGTWLEYMTDSKKQATMGRIINVSVDRKRKILSSVLFKGVGLGLNVQNGEDAFDTTDVKKFINALGRETYDVEQDVENREFLNHYMLMFTSIFGNYEDIQSTLMADKTDSLDRALLDLYENQRADEVATIDGAYSLINAKFFDDRRYDLTKAGRYKLGKKLSAFARAEGYAVGEDIYDAKGNVAFAKGTKIDKHAAKELRAVLMQGTHMDVMPYQHRFSHPDVVDMNASYTAGLVGRIVAEDFSVEDRDFEQGLVLTREDAEFLDGKVESVRVYAGVMAKAVTLTPENVNAVLTYGQRFYSLGRLVDENGDVTKEDGELYVSRYVPDYDVYSLENSEFKTLYNNVVMGAKYTVYLVGAAVQVIMIENPETERTSKAVCIDPISLKKTITISDMYAQYSYLLNMTDGLGEDDDIDQLGNRRIRTVGELIQNQFRIGLSRMERVVKERMSIQDVTTLTPKNLTNIRPLTAAIKEFFASSQLSQFMDQQNPLAELTNKRRISALGPGGLTRERAGFEVRDVHNTHYGRICPIETPEGPNIGLINNLTTYARVNEYGFIQTPYRVVGENYEVTENVVYLSADEEIKYYIAQANEVQDGHLVNDEVVCRYKTETIMAKRDQVELVDVSPKQIVSVATACIPFLENDDASRALMGANMQRQAVPLLNPHSPYVGTGMEHRIATDSGSSVVAQENGVVTYVDSTVVKVAGENGEHVYKLAKFRRSNAGTCINQRPIVTVGEKVDRGDVLADGPSMQNGELALGQNVTIAFMTWNGYNYEDAIIMSERLVADDVYTSVHIECYDIECRETKLGPEEITRDIPNVSEAACRNLDARGIVMVGAEVKEGDILVGKVTPKGQSEISPEEKLLLAIFGEKSREVRDNSLKVEHGAAGIIQSVRVFKRSEGYELPPGVNEVVKVYIVQKRKIHEGDKMAGRHGNKGVVSKILPVEDMPYLPDGTPVDIMLNPFGVPSRMNIGQVLEIHLGYAAKKLGVKFATSVFDGINNEELQSILDEAGSTKDGKTLLYDGRTGEPFDQRIAVGVMYMIKLAHMVDDKLHARSTGPYSLVTQQPLGGKAQRGGQRFGEMEVWALEAYGASNTLQEILTYKSDDVQGRTKTYEAIIKGKDIPEPGVPESFRVLKHELQALALDVKLLDEEGNEVNIDNMAAEEANGKPSNKPEMVVDASELDAVKTEDEIQEAVAGIDSYDMM